MFKVQLNTEQHVFVIKTYYQTSSYLEVKAASLRRFSKKDPPENMEKEKEQV